MNTKRRTKWHSRLRIKFIAFFVGVFFVISSFSMYMIYAKWSEQSSLIERSIAQKNSKIVSSLLSAFIDRVQSQTQAYSKWTELYEQMAEHRDNQAFTPPIFQKEFNQEALEAIGIDYLAVWDARGHREWQYVHSRFNGQTKFEEDIDDLETSRNLGFYQKIQLIAYEPRNKRIFCGNHIVDHHLMYLCIGNINNAQGTAKNAGAVIIGKVLSNKQKTNIESITGGEIAFSQNINAQTENLDIGRFYNSINKVLYQWDSAGNNIIIYLKTTDMFSKPTGFITLTYPKTQIMLQNKKMIEIYILLGALMTISMCAIYYFTNKFIRRIGALQTHVRKVKDNNNWEKKHVDQHYDEISDLTQDVNDLTTTINTQVLALHNVALKDSLTGLYNRRFYDQKIEHKVEQWFNEGFSFVQYTLLDVDKFKPYNDNYGHQAGDVVLIEVAKVLTEMFKNEEAIICRLGGEEFVVIRPLHQRESQEALTDVYRRYFEHANIEHIFNDPYGYITVSGGSITVDYENFNVSTMYNQADAGLYIAKSKGRNTIIIL